MDLTLKDLRKAAEQDMGGINRATSEVSNLKQVINTTVKATKVARGSEQPKADDADQLIDEINDGHEEKKHSEDDEDEEEGSVDVPMDTDGKKKQAMTEYEGES